MAALKEFCDTLAMGLFNIQAAVDPEKIAIGGGISQQPILHEYIQRSLDEIYEKMPIQFLEFKLFHVLILMIPT
ncbi:ROK family protein [Coprobacillaceae bacterium CR2/5/TPMF4]|nr:ROK family protein [Coprobacillaceae bacterium CR2/5/TPMF4]